MAWFIGSAKEKVCSPTRWRHLTTTPQAGGGYQLYEATCQREGVVDFAGLLLRSYEVLGVNSEAMSVQRPLQHILVDEFQDTNTLQYRRLRLLAGHQTAVLAVGRRSVDHAFPRRQVANMQHFEHDFGRQRSSKLEQNCRSFGNIRRRQRADPQQQRPAGRGCGPIRDTASRSGCSGLQRRREEAAFVIDSVKRRR